MRRSKILLMGLLIWMCAGCSPSLRPTPEIPRSLAGDWVADAARCDAIEAQLHTALDAARDKELHSATKRGSHRSSSSDQGIADTHMGPYSWEVSDQREQYQALFDAVRPVVDLNIVQQHGQIIFNSTHMAQRNFEPGTSSTLVTTFADLHIVSGWQAEDFVVYSKDGRAGVEIYEKYRLLQNGTLMLSVTLSVKYMDSQQFTLVYHRNHSA